MKYILSLPIIFGTSTRRLIAAFRNASPWKDNRRNNLQYISNTNLTPPPTHWPSLTLTPPPHSHTSPQAHREALLHPSTNYYTVYTVYTIYNVTVYHRLILLPWLRAWFANATFPDSRYRLRRLNMSSTEGMVMKEYATQALWKKEEKKNICQ